MPIGFLLDLEEYTALQDAKNTLLLWNEFMDELDKKPEVYNTALEMHGHKPGDTLFALFNAYKLRQTPGSDSSPNAERQRDL